jgi:predicted phosphodiesterase
MRLFLGSDFHVDYRENLTWLENLSVSDFTDDVLIVAGDLSDDIDLVRRCFDILVPRYKQLLFLPGNHDLWTARNGRGPSFEKFDLLNEICNDYGIDTKPLAIGKTLIVPLLAWYDYSFGEPGPTIRRGWMDFYKCNWEGLKPAQVAERFDALNVIPDTTGFEAVYSVSHFVPRLDLMPARYPEKHKALFPVLGTDRLETRIRALGSSKHFYGHSHLNRNKVLDGVTYINTAFGYPSETEISAKTILQVADL